MSFSVLHCFRNVGVQALFLKLILRAEKKFIVFSEKRSCEVGEKQGPGAEQFFDAPAPLLFNKLWLRLQLQISSSNFTFQFEILIHNIYYKEER